MTAKQAKIEARKQASHHGHMLGNFVKQGNNTFALCLRCGKRADIEDNVLVLKADTALTSRCS
jgi:hypothetical protein